MVTLIDTENPTMTFDKQVAALRGSVVPKQANKRKADCTPEEWAAKLDYDRALINSYRAANPKKRQATDKAYRDRNDIKEKKRAWAKANIEKNRAYQKAWKDANLEKSRAYQREYQKARYKNDPLHRMMDCLRARQRAFFKGRTRSLSMVRDMGCTPEFFKRHIESQLTAGMTMENYGSVWHLDHVFPLSKASIVDNPIHFLAAANWRNLRPMLGPENRDKWDNITPEAQALFDQLCAEFSEKAAA